MKTLSLAWIPAITVIAASTPSAPAQHQHAGDVVIGRSAMNQLLIEADLDECRVLAPVVQPLEGWSGDEPGFDALHSEEPDEDLYPLAPGADIWLEIVAIEPALLVVVPPDYDILDSPGQSVRLGDQQLHKHLLWLIDATDSHFDPRRCIWQATFILRDAGNTGYADSAPFTIRFATAEVVAADLDCDADVDLSDFLAFQACFNGPNRAAKHADCLHQDLDMDGDVDLQDFLDFQACFNGPNRPPKCS